MHPTRKAAAATSAAVLTLLAAGTIAPLTANADPTTPPSQMASGQPSAQPPASTSPSAPQSTGDTDTPSDVSWSVSLNGRQVPATLDANKTLTGGIDLNDQTPDPVIRLTSSMGDVIYLPASGSTVTARRHPALGVTSTDTRTVYQAAASGHHPAVKITATSRSTTGEPITVQDGTPFSRQADGTWQATTPTSMQLDGKNQPEHDTISLSNGQSLRITWDKPTTMSKPDVNGGTLTLITRQGSSTATISVNGQTEKISVHVTASRAQDASMKTLTLVTARPDGTTEQTGVPGFTPQKTDYTINLPAKDVTNAYSLTATGGADATIGQPSARLDGTSRILTIPVNGRTYTVTVRFQDPAIQPDSPAKLSGIYVNRSGQHTPGSLIDGWDPNRLDYTITVAEHDPSPYILPIATAYVTIQAGDVTNTADATSQAWKVTTNQGQAYRTYTVTVIRQHAWKTASEAFTPRPASSQESTGQPSTDKDTSLTDVGYVDKDGTYHPQKTDTWQIPPDATFTWRPKTGQSTSVASTRLKGMTWQYTVNVLAPNGRDFAQHTYTVTYITPATHQASLTGILVNGNPLPTFTPRQTSYTVSVDNTQKWTITPQYDKTTGMSVTTSKNGNQATITATSADGLIQTTYTITAAQKHTRPGAGATGVTVSQQQTTPDLASTGSDASRISLIGILTSLAAATALGIKHAMTSRRRQPKHA